MQSLLNPALFFGPNTYTASELRTMYHDGLPESTRHGFFANSASDYLQAIATYFNGSPERPMCTLAHVTALVQHPDFKEVFSLLQSDPAASPFILQLQIALAQGAEKQVASVVTHLQRSFAHLNPGRETVQRIRAIMQQDLVA